MVDNLFFISGPHGSGKSTLIKRILRHLPCSVSPSLSTEVPQFYWGEGHGEIDYFHRQVLKIAQRAIENYEYWEFARRSPDKLVIGDRCKYDDLAYRMANVSLGWINKGDLPVIDRISILYNKELQNPRAIVLNPPIEVIQRHLGERWKRGEKWKFQEDNLDYLRAVCNAFSDFRGKVGVLYLDSEVDLSDPGLPRTINDWIKQNYPRYLSLPGRGS